MTHETLVKRYHRYHGDKKAEIVRELKRGVYLVHLTNAAGMPYSIIDMITHGKEGEYCTELFCCERPNEEEMVQFFMEDKDDDT